jgi:hypothetical protein
VKTPTRAAAPATPARKAPAKATAAPAVAKRVAKAPARPAAKMARPASRTGTAKPAPAARKTAASPAVPKRNKEELVALVAKHERTIQRMKDQRKLMQASTADMLERIAEMEKVVSKLEKQAPKTVAEPKPAKAPARRGKKAASAATDAAGEEG